MKNKGNPGLIEKTLALALLLLILFASPMMTWWSRAGFPWYTPYLFWLLVIVLTAVIQVHNNRHDL